MKSNEIKVKVKDYSFLLTIHFTSLRSTMKLWTANNKHTLVLVAVLIGLAGYSEAALFQRNGGCSLHCDGRAWLTVYVAAPAWHNWDNSQLERWLTDHKVPNPGQSSSLICSGEAAGTAGAGQ